MSYRIGSLNCLNYGLNNDKSAERFAQIILDYNMDIIALQEIMHPYSMKSILRYLGPHWEGSQEDDYAFLWNTRRLRLPVVTVGSTSRIYQPRIYRQYRHYGHGDLVREPYFARFTPSGLPGGANFEIRLINTHIRFSKGTETEDTVGAIAMRRQEFNVLARAIYAKEADKVYGDNMPAYTILLGDYNLNKFRPQTDRPSTSFPLLGLENEVFVIADGRSVKKIVTEQSGLTTLKRPIKEENNGVKKAPLPKEQASYFVNNFDHLSYDSKRYEGVSLTWQRIDAVKQYYNGDFEAYRNEVSDHVPILIELELNARR